MFLDTSGLLSIFDIREKHHALAVEQFHGKAVRVTTSYVLAEPLSLMIARGISQKSMLGFARAIQNDRKIDLLWVTQEMHLSGMDLLSRRLDKTYTLCDAISFNVMHAHNLAEALTTDIHFEQEGFRRLLK